MAAGYLKLFHCTGLSIVMLISGSMAPSAPSQALQTSCPCHGMKLAPRRRGWWRPDTHVTSEAGL